MFCLDKPNARNQFVFAAFSCHIQQREIFEAALALELLLFLAPVENEISTQKLGNSLAFG